MLIMFFVHVLILIASMSNVFCDIPKIVILSFDGIHPQYINKDKTPRLFDIINANDKAAGPLAVNSVFPSKTAATHFSISTGVDPNVHGVYNNDMFGPNGQVWSYEKEQFQTNKNIVPIWIENQKTEGGRHSGMMMWPGGEFEYNDTKPTHIEKYNPDLKWDKRVDKIVKWMTAEEKKANLVMAYFEDTPFYDKNKAENHIREHMEKIDQAVEKLYEDLKNAMPGGFHMIVMSDHGTEMITNKNILDANSLLKKLNKDDDYHIIFSGPLLCIKTKPDEFLNIKSKFKDSLVEHYFVMNENLPFLTDVIVLLAEDGYTFYEHSKFIEERTDNYVVFENGYNVLNENMDSFFVGIGNNFKKITNTTNPIMLVYVYQILKKLLDLPADASDVQKITEYDESVKEILSDSLFPKTISSTES